MPLFLQGTAIFSYTILDIFQIVNQSVKPVPDVSSNNLVLLIGYAVATL